jgi:AraC-like DNA-binding protein
MQLQGQWLERVVRELQISTGRLLFGDPQESGAVLRDLVARAVPRPDNAAERLLLFGILQEFAFGCGKALHAAYHRASSPCDFRPRASLVAESFHLHFDDPPRAFLHWSTAFLEDLHRSHPLSLAARAARTIRDRYEAPLDVPDLAACCGVTAAHLRRAFASEYRLTLREYHQLARMISAMERVRAGQKVESIVAGLGYNSRKNFHRAFRRATAMTPSEFRELPAASAAELLAAKRRRL